MPDQWGKLVFGGGLDMVALTLDFRLASYW